MSTRTPERFPAPIGVFFETYAAQLDDIGTMLVKHGIVTAEAIARDGVRFALQHRFEPLSEDYKAKYFPKVEVTIPLDLPVRAAHAKSKNSVRRSRRSEAPRDRAGSDRANR